MSGFGSVRAMQDSLKMNREQLKKHRTSARDLATNHRLKSYSTSKARKLSDTELKTLRHRILKSRKRERTRQRFLLICLVFFMTALIFSMFL